MRPGNAAEFAAEIKEQRNRIAEAARLLDWPSRNLPSIPALSRTNA
jgi:hypothetical protein